MILGDLLDLVCGMLRHSDAATRAQIATYARQRHKMLHAAALWRDSLWVKNVAVTAEQEEVILPAQFERVIEVKLPDQPVPVKELQHWFQFDPHAWENVGTLWNFSHLAALGVATLPASAGELLKLVSSNAADLAVKVTIDGENNGEIVRETLTLNGMAVVLSVNQYTHPISISKDETAGDITISGNTSLATLVKLLATETHRRHARIRLVEMPVEAATISILAKRVCHDLRDDSAAMTLRGLSQAWQCFTLGDAWKWKRQYSKANAEFAEGLALLEQAKKSEAWQQATEVTIRPAEPLGGDCSIDGMYQ